MQERVMRSSTHFDLFMQQNKNKIIEKNGREIRKGKKQTNNNASIVWLCSVNFYYTIS